MNVRVRDAESAGVENALVKVKAIGSGNEPVYENGGGALVKEVSERTAATTGLATFTLTPNTSLIPTDSYYRIEIKDIPGERKARVLKVRLTGSGTFDVEDVLHEPGTVETSALAAHRATIKTHDDVSDTAPTAGQVLIWDGTNWTPGDTVATDLEAAALVTAHSVLTTGVHGVGASTVESVSGAQAKVDDADSVAFRSRLLLQEVQAAKGGRIGTNGKPVVAIRYDDYQDAFRENIYPLHVERGLPASMALVSRWTTTVWGADTVTADVVSWNRNGIEIWSHGIDHNDRDIPLADYLEEELALSKQEIEALDSGAIKCQGFARPGVTPVYHLPDAYGTTLQTFDDYTLLAGRKIMQNYGISEGSVQGDYRPLPMGQYHGLMHKTVSDGITLAQALAVVDQAIRRNLGVELMCHSGRIMDGIGMPLADYTTLLDYIVEKWDAGDIEVLTPSGLVFADPGYSWRLDLAMQGGFEETTTGATAAWDTGWSTKTVETSGGRTGSNFLRILSTDATMLEQKPAALDTIGLGGQTFLFEGWCRSNGAGTTTARVRVQDFDDSTRLNITKFAAGITAGEWQRVRLPFSLHPLTDTLKLNIGRNSGDGIDWDDVSVKVV